MPIITNYPRDNRFRPLASAEDPRVRPTYAEQFLLDTPPRVLSHEAVIPNNTTAPFDRLSPANLVQLAQLTLPYPMPVAITLGAYFDTADQFRLPARFNAENDLDNFPLGFPTGRYVIEWGAGDARNHLFTDLAPGSIQLPAAQSVSVSAHTYQTSAIAGVTLLPGAELGRPSATYTQLYARSEETGPAAVQGYIQPYAREMAIALTPRALGSYDDLEATLEWLSIIEPMGTFLVPAPTRANVSTRPHGAFALPIPGGADRFNCFMQPVASSGQGAVYVSVVQSIHL